ncbi:MAG: dTDP-4-dehydrorhamnose reductase [Proteobacteria bacterium]|nr:dTDP-4-dehydrorhamnose reductase [Pseudomonadota bacterium]
MKVLVFGARGMLGKDLVPALSVKHQVLARDIEDLDITDQHRVQKEIEILRPQVVVNAAAYTDVDGCESNKELAFAVNADGARNIAAGCAAINARMIHLSTDYVFDGTSSAPYREEDPPHPLNVHGSSKLLGEHYVQEILRDHLIIRTEWLFGRHGKNFVDTILRLAAQQEELRVVNDQRGAPTFTKDLSWAIEKLLEKEAKGILHITNSGSCTWYEFARRILREKNIDHISIIPISSAELTRPAERPANSILNCHRFETLVGQKMRNWEEALKEYLA